MKVTHIESGLELYDSISFLALDLGSSEIIIGEGTETLKLIFEFRNDDDADKDKKAKLEWEINNESSITAILTNWNDPLGTTLVKPITGTLLNRELTFTFSIKKVGTEGEVREVMLSVYLGREVQNG